MSKDQKIIIEFDQDLIGSVTNNQSAFAVSAQEYDHVNGALVSTNYTVSSTERVGFKVIPNLTTATLTDLTYSSSTLKLMEG